MSKRLIIVLALAFVVGLAFAAYAEVQNVKVSGDLTVYGVGRNNTDLAKERHSTIGDRDQDSTISVGQTVGSDTQANAISIVRLRVDADLTDNVSATVRLLNERAWGGEDDLSGGAETGSAVIQLDLAYAQLKEFLYSPLSLTVGRQELHFGNDLIVGAPMTNGYSSVHDGGLPLYERDLSARRAFDAVRATLNYDPLVVDLIWAKVFENNVSLNDDTTLTGINANYALDKQTTLEGYFFSKIKGTNATQFTTAQRATVYEDLTAHGAIVKNLNKADKVFTVGGRVKNSTLKNLTLQLESAYQFGTWNPAYDINSANQANITNRKAWSLEALVDYNLKDMPVLAKYIAKYSPSISGSYVYLSGDNSAQKRDDKSYNGWDPMYEGQSLGHLVNVILGFSNITAAHFGAKMKPVDDVTLKLDYVYLWFNKAYRNGDLLNLKNVVDTGVAYYRMTHGQHLGQEIDTMLTYDYTEDVQFGLLAGVFVPGSAFAKGTSDYTPGNRNVATELIGSMKVTF